jgi:3-isopropylmalate dehydrogenase
MLLDLGLGLQEEAAVLERAIGSVLAAGIRTADVAPRGKAATTSEVAAAVVERIATRR